MQFTSNAKSGFDQHGINHMTVALRLEMTPNGRPRPFDSDTLFMGGTLPSDSQLDGLGHFGTSKNYRIIYASFDPANPAAGPLAFHAIVTDGLAECFALSGGRLWKRDRASAAVLVFPGINGVVKMTGKGRLMVREARGQHHEDGYQLARTSLIERAGRRPGKVPVVSTIGGIVTVLDIDTMVDTFKAAA